MTIYWIGMEEIDFSLIGGDFAWGAISGQYRPDYARASFYTGYGDGGDPNGTTMTGNKWSAPLTTFWFGGRMTFPWWGRTNCQVVAFKDPSDVTRLMMRISASNEMKLSKRTSGGTITDLVTFTAPTDTVLRKIDFYVNYAVSGQIDVYYDGILAGTYSGDITTDGATQLQRVVIGGTYGNHTCLSELVVSDTDTRSMAIKLLTTSTAGNAQQWAGAAENVNQSGRTVNDSAYIYSDTADQIQQYQPAALPSGAFNVKAVAFSMRSMRGSGGPQNLQPVLRVAGADYTPIAEFSPLLAFENKLLIAPTNPATSSDWVQSDLAPANLHYGLKSKA